jgi:hypothetical protein
MVECVRGIKMQSLTEGGKFTDNFVHVCRLPFGNG